MNLDQFDYQLPENLIAQSPLQERSASRLLYFKAHTNEFKDFHFLDLLDLVYEEDLLVFNDTKVIPARLFAMKGSGGKVEFLLERMLNSNTVLAQLKASKSPKLGSKLIFSENIEAVVSGRQEQFFVLQFKSKAEFEYLLNNFGQTPLPPYIHRSPEQDDIQRYQTVYARHNGAVAAPTAGLHFDDALLNNLKNKGVQSTFITLHVGAGTFQPVRENNIEQHAIHAEQVIVSQHACDQIFECKKRGGRVIAVGTTAVRALESAAQKGWLQSYTGDTSLFIYPGFKFKVVDALITNFHLPKSTLLMLVSAFAGYDSTMSAYHHAVSKSYRFYSYGDAMFIA